MEMLLLVLVVLVVGGAFWWWQKESATRREQELADAAATARRWYERLGGQVLNLSGDDPAVRQALADAGERYNAAGSQLEQARTVHQFQLAQETALEGLLYARAARVALGIDPGPELPPLAAARGAGSLTEDRRVDVEGQTYRAGPQPSEDKPYYYPGGRVQGRALPAGWYSQPIWKPALAGVAGGMAGMMLINALAVGAVYSGPTAGAVEPGGFEMDDGGEFDPAGGFDPGDAGGGFDF